MNIKTVARLADVPADLAEFFRSMPHYRAGKGRDSYRSMDTDWDPLTTQGTHRSEMVLTGYMDMGDRNGFRFYVLRFTRYAHQSWSGAAATVFYTAQVGNGRNMIYAADYEKPTERTRKHAIELTQTLLASTDAWRGDLAAELRRNFEDHLADEVGAWDDGTTEELRARIPSPLSAAGYLIRQDRRCDLTPVPA